MAKMKPEDLSVIYNNIAINKKLPLIQPEQKFSLNQIADKIEWANESPYPSKTDKKMPQFNKIPINVPSGIFAKILYLFTGLEFAK